ncbi:OmpH family outer membrane protein [Gaetbulibacter jejuensis]|uniref:Periplasmic chaperone for outer membrane proteins Skp n=1 Tax=Gaetbulibacter jejuensis TaxID=584607 RepID=A0ABN1JDW6_9FLAO|nr:OmpH family outer membrane protein [Flavobacteriaceae bacterium 144Ye]
MKYLVLILVAALSFSSCQEQQKLAFIDNGKVINEYQEKIDLEKKYEQKDLAFQKRRDSMISNYQLELKEAQLKAKNMSQANLQKLSQEIQQKEQLLTQRIQMEQQQMQKAFQTDIDSLIVKVKNFVNDYGKKNQYSYIFGTSDTAASVLYGSEDLSQTIIDALNADYKKEE